MNIRKEIGKYVNRLFDYDQEHVNIITLIVSASWFIVLIVIELVDFMTDCKCFSFLKQFGILAIYNYVSIMYLPNILRKIGSFLMDCSKIACEEDSKKKTNTNFRW